VKSIEGALLPQVSASAGVSNSFRNTVPGSSQDGSSNAATVGARLSIPIYQGGRVSAQVRQSKESLGQARIEVDVSRDRVRAAVTSAWTQYVAAQERVSANRESVAAAQLALNGVIEERNVGQRTTLDVLNAQADVITAQINLVSSERDVVVASYAILSAVGRLSAERLQLQVALHHPEEHYDAVKDKWFGLRTPDGR
jgi:outer membrane protein